MWQSPSPCQLLFSQWRELPRERGSWTTLWHHNTCIRDAEMWKSCPWAAAKRGRTEVSFKAVQVHCQAEDMGYVHQWVLVCPVDGWRRSPSACLHGPSFHSDLEGRSSHSVHVWGRSCGVQQPEPGEAEEHLGRQTITMWASPCKVAVPQAFRHTVETICKCNPTFKWQTRWEPTGRDIHTGREIFTEVWTLISHISWDCPSWCPYPRL